MSGPNRKAIGGTPRVITPELDEEQKRVAFVMGAPGRGLAPWSGPVAQARANVMLQLNVSIPEPLMLKLITICQINKTTKRAFTEKALEAAVEIELRRLGIDPD